MGALKERNVATAEFKVRVSLDAVRGVKTINAIRPAYDVHPTQAALWKKGVLERAKTLFAGKPVAAHQEPDRL